MNSYDILARQAVMQCYLTCKSDGRDSKARKQIVISPHTLRLALVDIQRGFGVCIIFAANTIRIFHRRR